MHDVEHRDNGEEESGHRKGRTASDHPLQEQYGEREQNGGIESVHDPLVQPVPDGRDQDAG